METEKTLTEQESLDLISKMILTTKTSISNDGIYYQLWGWGVFAAAIINFILLKAGYENGGLAWIVLMPLCGIATFLIGRRQARTARVKTFVDDYLGYLWIGFGVSLFIVLTFQNAIGLDHVYPVVMVLYGIGTFVSGGALQFTPLKVGGILCWALALVSIRFSFDYQLLIIAAAVLVSYIIPGYLLRRKYYRESAITAKA